MTARRTQVSDTSGASTGYRPHARAHARNGDNRPLSRMRQTAIRSFGTGRQVFGNSPKTSMRCGGSPWQIAKGFMGPSAVRP
jgi:hypothetical protein